MTTVRIRPASPSGNEVTVWAGPNLRASQNYAAVHNGTGAYRIGRTPNDQFPLQARIGHILLYNRAESAAEIAQNYAALKTKILPAKGITLT